MNGLLLALGAALAAPAEAPPPEAIPVIDDPVSYALVVGSNRPGPGQQALRYASADARRMAEVLSHVGGVAPERVMHLEDPDPAELISAIDGFSEVLAAHEQAGTPTTFVFYYSGHARAQGLDLGEESVALPELRRHLEDLEARLTLVVLDACQSGAASGIKGVGPAADFSSASVNGLQAEGFVVIASSTGSELSQESAELGGSFFTHHLSTGLLGAADDDRDGLVTLSEAYDYAYGRTLVATAATAVGAQHATLETRLEGQGDLVLARPAEASARLLLPAELAGDLLILRSDTTRVVAEVHKALGRSQELALVPGPYEVILREADTRFRCTARLDEGGVHPLDLAACHPVAEASVAAKGALTAEEEELARLPPPRLRGKPAVETFFVEASLGYLATRSDDYTATLGSFGFEEQQASFFPGDLNLGLSAVRTLHRNLAVVGILGKLDDDARTRPITSTDDSPVVDHTFSWTSWRLGVGARGQLVRLDGWLVPYAQVGAGLGLAGTTYTDPEGDHRELHAGPWLGGALGLQVMPTIRDWRHVGFFLQQEWVTAPVIDNLLGQRHDSGGSTFTLGLRVGG